MMAGPVKNKILSLSIDIGDSERLEIVEITGATSGPVVAIIGGVHGDEDEGVLSAKRLVKLLSAQTLNGTVRILAVANPPAFRAGERLSPVDNKNLAREFPGSATGSMTERIAHAISSQVIAGADALIDLHSAGAHYGSVLFCGYFELDTPYSRKAARLARAFGAPIVWAHTVATHGRTVSTALDLGVPAIYAECGGGGQVRASELAAYVDGSINVLVSLGVIEGELTQGRAPSLIEDPGGDADNAINAPESGVLVTHVSSGDIVQQGAVLCEIYDVQGNAIATVQSPVDGIVIFVRRTARTDKGQMVALLAAQPKDWSA